jgi:hypothetical protein
MTERAVMPEVRSAYDLREERKLPHPMEDVVVAQTWLMYLDRESFDTLASMHTISVEWAELSAHQYAWRNDEVRSLLCRWLRELGYVVRTTFKHVVISLPVAHQEEGP